MSRRSRSRGSNRKPCLYCGPSRQLPPGYDGFGNNFSCLRKGVGVGKFGERRTWQRRMGQRVPEYISDCPRLPVQRRRLRQSRSESNSSDESDSESPHPRRRSYRGGRSRRLTRLRISRSGRYRYSRRSRSNNRSSKSRNSYRKRANLRSRRGTRSRRSSSPGSNTL
jgi:hypothetical protein